MLAVSAGPFSADGWIFEIEYDGFRLLAGRTAGRPRLRYRSGVDATSSFPEIAAALARLPGREVALDGEVVVLGDDGRPRFQRLQRRCQARGADVDRAAAADPATLFAFDCLVDRGRDLRARPLRERKERLRALLAGQSEIRYVDHVERDGLALYEEARGLGLEGIVAKRDDAPYAAGRSRDWRKIRIERTGTFLVVGYTITAIGEEGGLHIAAADGPALRYAGRVGSGFETGVLAEARALLAPFLRREPACEGSVPRGRGHAWVEPRIACEVRYKETTDAGLLRHPVFIRFRR